MKFIVCVSLSALILCACASSKDLKPPKALPSNWQDAPMVAPAANANDNRVHTPHMQRVSHTTSLWSSSPKSLFGDRRASQMGDILTVEINIDEEAKLQNSLSTDYSSKKNMEASAFFGIPELINKVLPTGASLTPAVDLTNSSNQSGQGNISRKEKLTLRLAARVDSVLPNGYLSVRGTQEIIVNDELRYLHVTGIIRIADISRLNTITYDKIADAKIFYGGRGQMSRAVEEKAGNRVISKILPF